MNKIQKLREKMKTSGLDAILVFDEINCRYFSKFLYHDGAFLITEKDSHLLTDFRYYEAAINSVNPTISVTKTKEREKYIKDVLHGCGAKTLGFVGKSVTYSEFEAMSKSYADLKLTDVGDMIDTLRAIKENDEILSIAKAQDIADKAFAALLSKLEPSMTEIDVAAEIDYLLRRNGAEGSAFSTIAVSGEASSLPHGVPRNVKLKRGFLTMDFGAIVNGYCSDMTRTVSIGCADSEMKKMYSTVLLAQQTALDYLKEGVIASDTDRVARDIIEGVPEYRDAFGHSLGHSVGLEVHELPSLSPKSKSTVLKKGNVVTVEPGIYLEGKYGCRIEDMVLIGENGITNFTKSPKELVEIY